MPEHAYNHRNIIGGRNSHCGKLLWLNNLEPLKSFHRLLIRRLLVIVAMKIAGIFAGFILLVSQAPAQQTFRYFYDDANELYRVIDSTGTMIEYTYDPAGNIVNVARTNVQTNALVVFNVTPTMAIGGSKIMIFGQNFSSIAAGDIVTIGGVAATVVAASNTQLVVLVPPGTNGGAVYLTVGGVTVTWSNTISVTQPPIIESLNPNFREEKRRYTDQRYRTVSAKCYLYVAEH